MSPFEKRAPVTLRALTDLTDAPVASAPMEVANDSLVTLFLRYTTTSPVGVVVVPEVLHQGGDPTADDDWSPAVVTLDTGPVSDGLLPAALLTTGFTMDAAGRKTVRVRVEGGTQFRVRVGALDTPTDDAAEVIAVASRGS